MRKIFLIIFALIALASKAQEPSYTVIGEDFFSGTHIYSLHQDKELNYWIASNKGVYKYDGIEIKEIPIKNANGSSFFRFQENEEGIFSYNLNGQIFKIHDDVGEVFFELPDSLISAMTFICLNSEDELIVVTNKTFKITKSKKVKIISKKGYHSYAINAEKYNNPKEYPETKLLKSMFNEKKHSSGFFNVIRFNSQFNIFKRESCKLISVKTGKNVLQKECENPVSAIFSSKGLLWLSYTTSGIDLYDTNYHLLNKKLLFPSLFISAFLEDKEGNILLGTFNDGIIFIPNPNITTITGIPKNKKIQQIASNKKNEIYIGNIKGEIYKIDKLGNFSFLFANHFQAIEILEYLPEENGLLFNSNEASILNLNTGKKRSFTSGSLKDIEPIGFNQYLLATNMHIRLYNPDNSFHPFFIEKGNHLDAKALKNYPSRYYCVNYDRKNNTIYAGSSVGLKIGKAKKTPTTFTLNDKNILATDILYFENTVFVSTQKNGILVFKNNNLTDVWDVNNGFVSNYVLKIEEYKNHLYIATDKGLIIASTNGKIEHILNNSEGLYTNKIIDFEICDNELLILNQKGIQRIDINSLSSFSYLPEIYLKQILINDSIVLNETKFDYNFNKFSFLIGTNSYKFKNEINYKHRLIPIENNWQIGSYQDYKIDYKSLSPGSYTFEVKSTFRDLESKTISYHFYISPPIWQRWWFFLIVITITILLTILIFYNGYKKKLKKAHLLGEVNASKLTAIQSQMNPHFIFNALNSIQDLVLRGDVDNSYTYITKFANLVRKTLTYSDKEFIPFENEIKLLELYLNIEKLRFKHHFSYSLEINNIDDILVPPMLVQPFVENALVHGLLHKEGDKTLQIDFELNQELICKITDNGIGRIKSAEIKRRQKSHSPSFAINAIKKRLNILKKRFGDEIGIKYVDLTSSNGKSSGTTVILKIPVKHLY